MKKKLSITQLLLFVTWCAIAFLFLSRYFSERRFNGNINDFRPELAYSAGDRNIFFLVDDKDVEKSPPWHRADANPPVSIRSAIAIADQFREQTLDGDQLWDWGLDSITLYPLDGKNDKWCWGVHFSAIRSGYVGGPMDHRTLEVYVLMDGTVVPPEFEAREPIPERDATDFGAF